MEHTPHEIKSQRDYLDELETRCKQALLATLETNTEESRREWMRLLLTFRSAMVKLEAMLSPASE